jgi:hypothetical protein
MLWTIYNASKPFSKDVCFESLKVSVKVWFKDEMPDEGILAPMSMFARVHLGSQLQTIEMGRETMTMLKKASLGQMMKEDIKLPNLLDNLVLSLLEKSKNWKC